MPQSMNGTRIFQLTMRVVVLIVAAWIIASGLFILYWRIFHPGEPFYPDIVR
jgi:hypothetical protein